MSEMYYFRLFDSYNQVEKWNELFDIKEKQEYIYNLIEKKKNDKCFGFSDRIKEEKMLIVGDK